MASSQETPPVAAYVFFLVLFILLGWLHLATVLVTTLFAYLALRALSFGRFKWIAILLFLVLLAALFYGFAHFVRKAIVDLPIIVSASIPKIVNFANERGIDLPFTDVESLKNLAMESVQETLGYFGKFAQLATKEFVFLLAGIVVAMGIFLNPRLDYDQSPHPLNLYSLRCAQLAELFRSFYLCFERVMGAQVIISAINTVLTAIFIYACGLNYAPLIVVATFLCGLLPVVGNILSNTIIVGVAFTHSPQLAGWALVFLVTIHKLEYFLNSKIIGSRIRQPMWLTLLALILGERLLGITGIILAPVILTFVKTEASRFEVTRPAGKSG